MAQDIFGQRTAVAPFANNNKVRLTIQGLSTNDQIFLTAVKGDIKPNYQLQYSVGAGRYINSFTHRLSMFVIEGKYILANCNGPFDAVTSPAFFRFYQSRNISNSSRPVRIAYSGIVITGFLVALTTGRHNQEALDGYSFTLTFLGSVNGLSSRPPAVQAQAATTAYLNALAYTPGKTGPARGAENTFADEEAIEETPITTNVTALTDRDIRDQQELA
jgi:hypothetical protein